MSEQNSLDWKEWLKYATADKRLAESAREIKEARNLALCTHQMMEHALKALYLYLADKLAPRVHKLYKLAEFIDLVEKRGFTISDNERVFLRTLHSYFIPLRYPQTGAVLPTYKESVSLFEEACELFERIENTFPSD